MKKKLVTICAAVAVIALVAAGCAKKPADPAVPPASAEATVAAGTTEKSETGKKETGTEIKTESEMQSETVTKEENPVEAEKAPAEESKGVFEEFTAQDLDGSEVTQEIFADYDVTMINIWATFCGPCLSEMPELGELSAEYNGKGLQIIGVVSDVLETADTVSASQIEEAKNIVDKTKADYLHVVPAGDLAYNLLPQVPAVPTTIFVDKDGKQIGGAVVGARSKGAWEKIIDDTLKAAGVE